VQQAGQQGNTGSQQPQKKVKTVAKPPKNSGVLGLL